MTTIDTEALRARLAAAICSETNHWDEPLDEVHDVPQIVNAVLAERDAEVARLRDGWATATTAHAEEAARLRRQMASDNSALVIEAENVGRGIALVKTERARAAAAEAKVDRLGRELAAANAERQRLCTQQSAAAAEVAALREAAHVGIELDNHHNAAMCPYCRPTLREES